jgi:hypothetical protein
MKDETRQEISAAYAKDYTDWMVKTGGYARDMTLRDHLAGLAMQDCPLSLHADAAVWSYARADAVLKERAK